MLSELGRISTLKWFKPSERICSVETISLANPACHSPLSIALIRKRHFGHGRFGLVGQEGEEVTGDRRVNGDAVRLAASAQDQPRDAVFQVRDFFARCASRQG